MEVKMIKFIHSNLAIFKSSDNIKSGGRYKERGILYILDGIVNW